MSLSLSFLLCIAYLELGFEVSGTSVGIADGDADGDAFRSKSGITAALCDTFMREGLGVWDFCLA